jgi:hypothetical protein
MPLVPMVIERTARGEREFVDVAFGVEPQLAKLCDHPAVVLAVLVFADDHERRIAGRCSVLPDS